MANKKYKLSNSDYWATDGVWDFGQGKTQRQVNSDLNGAINDVADDVSDINNKFPVAIADGGTGATTAKQALINLGAMPDIFQIFYAASATSTLTTYTAMTGRKLSDFSMLLIIALRGGAFRASLIITEGGFRNSWASLTEVDSANTQRYYEVKRVDDTHITVQTSSNATGSDVIVYGVGNKITY